MSTVVESRPRLLKSVAPGRAAILPPRPVWMEQAACRGTDDPLFVADTGEAERAEILAERYCNRCPVHVQCLALALKTKSPDIWAGTTLEQRRAMARTRTRLTCPVCRCATLITVDRHDLCVACGRSWRTARRPPELEQDTTDGDDDR